MMVDKLHNNIIYFSKYLIINLTIPITINQHTNLKCR